MFGFGKKKGPTLGLDINSDSITLVQLDKTRAGVEMVHFACLPTPANTVREGLIADPIAIGSVITDLIQQAEIPLTGQSPTVNMTVPAQSVVIRLMPVPTGMPNDELAEVVTQEATNHVPFPISDANLDWSLMPATERTDSDGVRRVDVILAAVQRSIIDTCWRAADAAGVQLGKIEVSSLATLRGLALAGYTGGSGHVSMVVNIRQDATDINIVRSSMPLFGRSVIIGVETLTESISRSLEIDFEKSLEMLPEIPLFGSPPQTEQLGQAAQVARTIFSDITDEIERSLDFYQSQVGDVKIDQIILTGPGCMIPNLDQYIASRTSLKTIYGDAMRDMAFDQTVVVERMRPILASLIGTSIEPAWNPNFTVDLDLNKEGRAALVFDDRTTAKITDDEAPQAYWFKPTLAGGVMMMILAGLVSLYLTQFDVPTKEKQLTETNSRLMQARKDIVRISELRTSNSFLDKRRKVLNYLVKKTKRWSTYLDIVQENTPQDVQIDNIVFQPTDFQIEGVAGDFASVSRLSINLGANPDIAASSVEYATRGEKSPDVVSFAVTVRIKTPGMPGVPAAPGTSPAGVPGAFGGTDTQNVSSVPFDINTFPAGKFKKLSVADLKSKFATTTFTRTELETIWSPDFAKQTQRVSSIPGGPS